MGTRSTIWYKDKDENKYKGVYCHWDGYPSYNGKLLLENYNSFKKIKKLISYGSISSLNSTIETCEFYCRDRGEEMNIYEMDLRGNIDGYFEAYNYLFDGKWYLFDDNNELIELTKEMVKE